MTRYVVWWEGEAEADLAAFARPVRAAIRREVERLLSDQPLPAVGQRKALDVNPLDAPYRVRVVNVYRAYYDVEETVEETAGTVWVLRVGYKPGETLFLRGVPTPMRD